MSLVQCPSCAGRVSHLAAACPRCGYPIAVPPPPPRASGSIGVIVALAGLLCVVVVVVALGLFAAVAVPRFEQATHRAREAAAGTELRQLHALEQAQLASTGAYTANLTDPEADDYLAGWEGPSTPDYDFSAAIEAGGLCLEATPGAHLDAAVRPLSMDEGGALHAGAGCTGEVLLQAPGKYLPPDTAAAAADAPVMRPKTQRPPAT
ncbi:MAG TPA: hypothetical protein VEW03_05080 [Longimicrobiaceae bacterium]|nr:hypothetical protein [Longimicrobiaceae bacterium]